MSKLLENLPTLEAFAAEVRQKAREDARAYVKNVRENAKERLEKARQVREALTRLDAAGIEVAHFNTTYAYVSLGFFSTTKGGNCRLADAVRRVRLALGCRLENDGKTLGSAKRRTVEFTLKAAAYARFPHTPSAQQTLPGYSPLAPLAALQGGRRVRGH